MFRVIWRCQEPYTEVYGVSGRQESKILERIQEFLQSNSWCLEHAQDLFLLSHELK